MKKKRVTNLNIKLGHNLRARINQSFTAQKSDEKKERNLLIYLDVPLFFFKKWIIHQLYGERSIGNYRCWSLDHTYPLSETILSNEEDMRKCNHWIKIRSMYNTGINSKKAKIIQHLYLL